jgi:hypothetical protein
VRENSELHAKSRCWRRRINSGDGSLFDLRRDAVESIADIIGGNVTIGRFESIQRAITKKLAALKAADASESLTSPP